MSKTLLLLFLLATPLIAADGYEIVPEAGVGQLKRAPYLPIRVRVTRNDPQQPFAGRIVAQVSRYSRTGFGGNAEAEYAVEFSMEAGRAETVVLLDVPFNGAGMNASFVLERALGGGRYEAVTQPQPVNESPMNPDTPVIGFISTARLESINTMLPFFGFLEVPKAEMVPDWKALLAYDAILVNTEALTREQNDALVEYVAAGGTLIISPRTAASFNPGLPSGELLGIPSTAQSREATVGDYGVLFNEIKASGYSAISQLNNGYNYPQAARGGRRKTPTPPANTPKPAINAPANGPGEPDGSEENPDESLPTPTIKLASPSTDAKFTLWPSAGRARFAERTGNLVSVARVGAGLVVFIHADISRPPFTADNDAPSLCGANLLIAAFNAAKERGLGHTPLNLLATTNGRQLVDIAGHRIPGNASMIIVAFLYILAAGVGVFFLARKLKRPELYPAGLVAFGVISVVGVFGLGNWFKRAGERVNAVRVVVSDNVSGRAGTFSLGCAYVPSGGDYELNHGRHASLVVADLGIPGSRGMPNDLSPAKTRSAGSETATSLHELMQFQNVIFVAQEPVKRETLKFSVSGAEGALNLENSSDFDLRGCVVLVGKSVPGGGAAQWHYLPKLGSSGGTATLTASTTSISKISDLRSRLDTDLGANSLEYHALMTLFRQTNSYNDALALSNLEGALVDAGLMPANGEVLVISIAPADAVSAQSLGTPEEPGDVRQVCIWCVRCVIP